MHLGITIFAELIQTCTNPHESDPRMKITVILTLTAKFCLSVEVHHKKDFSYITGKGCGVKTPIKYLSTIPKNIEDHECSIIRPDLDGDAEEIDGNRQQPLHIVFI